MKITDYQKVTELLATNVFLLDGPGGTKTIFARDLLKALNAVTSAADNLGTINMSQLIQASKVDATDKILIGVENGTKAIYAEDFLFGILDSVASVEMRRNIFRGKNLGTAFTAEQKARIADGSFKGFFIGDYWEIGGKIWRIVDINYWIGKGIDPITTTNHLVIMPDKRLYTTPMNSSDTSQGAYIGSELYTNNLEEAKTLIYSAFGQSYILNHRNMFSNAVTDGHMSGYTRVDSIFDLPSEIQMYGHTVFTPMGYGAYNPNIYTYDSTQLALMKLYPRFINTENLAFWLRDPSGEKSFCAVGREGNPSTLIATQTEGVRGLFGIKGVAA